MYDLASKLVFGFIVKTFACSSCICCRFATQICSSDLDSKFKESIESVVSFMNMSISFLGSSLSFSLV